MRSRLTLPPRAKGESTIALINIVFLMLIFFLIAGSLAPRPDKDVTLVALSQIETAPPSDALVILADGSLRLAGQAIDLAQVPQLFAGNAKARILPDRAAPADVVVAVGRVMASAGIESLVIVTERALSQ